MDCTGLIGDLDRLMVNLLAGKKRIPKKVSGALLCLLHCSCEAGTLKSLFIDDQLRMVADVKK